MNAEIISVGTELLLGHTINTDAAFVALERSAIGVNLLFACTVGDNPGRLRDALEEALGRSDVVITTGGLGPTDDDLTKETIASVAGAPLKIHEDSLRRLESYFKGRPAMGENQRKQAMLPEGATVFPNDIGTAPGCGVRTASGKVIVMLPGPPSELVPMLQHYVVPFLKEGSHAVIHSCMIRTFGLGEGAGALKIADLTDAANPTAATYAKENEMFVRVTARAESEEAAEALCKELAGQEIGMGGSMTAAQLGLPEELEAAGCTVYARGRSWDRKDTDKGVTAPVYISSANGVAETGELVNIDGTGNRVAATLYGPEKVYFIVGLNKLAPTLEAAIWRARNIASPLNAKRLNRRTPCALSEVMKCYDCQSPERICRGMTIHMGPMKGVGETIVVLIDEELGY